MYYKIINKRKRFATKIGDQIGKIIFSAGLFHTKGGPIPFDDIQRILIIRTAYIGDVVLTLPILSPLKKLFPHAKISFLTTSNATEILKKIPYVDKIIPYDAFWFYRDKTTSAFRNYLKIIRFIRSRPYDLVIEARGDIRDISLLAYLCKSTYRISYDVGGGGFLLTHIVPFRKIKHKIQYHLDIVKYLGGKAASFDWDLYLTQDEKRAVAEWLKKKGISLNMPLVAIHPGARKQLKRWSIAGFAAVADRLVEEMGISIILLGGPDEVELAKTIQLSMKHPAFNFAGKTTLRQMTAILKRCNMFICNDSVPLHIASLTKTPTVAIFGPSKSWETGPYGNIHAVVEKPFECRYLCDENVCNHYPHNDCINSVTSDDVFDAAYHIYRCTENP